MLAYVLGAPRYGGQPCRLTPELLAEACELLLEGKSATAVAELIEYGARSTFSNAFFLTTGERPSAFQKRHGVGRYRPRQQHTRGWLARKLPDRSDAQPLPRFDAKPKQAKTRKPGRQ